MAGPLQKKTGRLRTNVEPERIMFKYKTAQPEINVINGGRTRRLRKGDVTCMFQLAILRRLIGENGIVNSVHGPRADGWGYHRLSNASVTNMKRKKRTLAMMNPIRWISMGPMDLSGGRAKGVRPAKPPMQVCESEEAQWYLVTVRARDHECIGVFRQIYSGL